MICYMEVVSLFSLLVLLPPSIFVPKFLEWLMYSITSTTEYITITMKHIHVRRG